MKKQYAVVASSLVFLAAFAACRAIVGITDLTVDAGADAAPDVPPMPDAARMESGAVDASLDTGAEATVDGRPIDARAEVDCSQPPSEAGSGEQGCVDNCISNHDMAAPEFYGAAYTCICANCASRCTAYCTLNCKPSTPLPLGECNDCANEVIEGDGGVCRDAADMKCVTGCAKLSSCIASCM